MENEWVEARLRPDAEPAELYQSLGEDRRPNHAHHFWDEPWWKNAYVVRVCEPDSLLQAALEESPFVDHVVTWNPQPDEELYGNYWPWVAQFFEASSILAAAPRHDGKLIHCFLNARGVSPRKEAWFAFRFAWNRLTIGIRWHLYLKRRWEREQGPPVVEAHLRHIANVEGGDAK